MRIKIVNSLIILLGNLLLAIGVQMFILPFSILSGGVAGVAVALYPLFHIDYEIIINSLIIVLFVIGWLVLGKEFAFKTILSSISYPIFLSVISPYLPTLELDPILASVYGGLVCGVGIGLVMRCGASTGGMDIPPLILNKLFNIKVSSCVIVIDALTVFLGLVAYDLGAVLLGLVSVYCTGVAIDKVLDFGGTSSKAVWIISDHYQDIIDRIHNELERGTTVSDAKGGYTNMAKKVVLCVVDAKQYPLLINIINDLDNKAFVITTDANDVHGEGFSFGFKV